MQSALGGQLEFELHEDRALIALQGPQAAQVLARHSDIPNRIVFMQAGPATVAGHACSVSRSGYTGEDGFEISVAADEAQALAETLLDEPEAAPAGLGARDSLRLEAGLCLYGHDMDTETDPVTAGLIFAIGKRRRSEGGFAGADTVLERIAEGTEQKRAGLQFEGRAPVREGAELVDEAGTVIGRVTSGTFSPTLQTPIAMGYLPAGRAKMGTPVTAMVRGREIAGRVAEMPFVPQNYVRSL